jgi:hypothetical protein
MKKKTRMAFSGTALAISAALWAAPAQAAVTRVDPAAAMSACRQGVGGVTSSVHVGPRDLGQFAGLAGSPVEGQIGPGAVVRVRASGRISYGGVFNWRGTWGPAGNGNRAPGGFPYPGGPDAALFGTWNQTLAKFPIGADSGCLWVPNATLNRAPYAIHLATNDDWRDDNGDVGYDATVTAWRYFGA